MGIDHYLKPNQTMLYSAISGLNSGDSGRGLVVEHLDPQNGAFSYRPPMVTPR